MANKLINIPNDDTQNYSFFILQLVDIQLSEPTHQNSIKVIKVFKPTNKKTLI